MKRYRGLLHIIAPKSQNQRLLLVRPPTIRFSYGLPKPVRGSPCYQRSLRGQFWMEKSSNFACFFLPIYIQLFPKKFKLKICDVATRKLSLTNIETQ